jgi:tetrapyrrole methylase family protein / MazG family protein
MEFKETRPLYLLAEIASILRAPNGCAWDRAQTSVTLRPYLIEEAYELYEAIGSGDPAEIMEELGDLVYQVYAHAQIAQEAGQFSIDDVAQGIVTKLIGRHPHVFGNEKADTPDEVTDKWEKIKKKEKAYRESILDGVPASLPALLKSYRVQQKASRIGFDWERIDGAIDKLDEEVAEFKEALACTPKGSPEIEEEMGDMLFTLVNIARFTGVNPEDALARTVNKFMMRFRFVEKEAAARGRALEEMSIEEMDALWERAKRADG